MPKQASGSHGERSRPRGRSMLAYLRSAGVVAILLGGAALIPGPDYFYLFAGFVYSGLILIGFDVFFEKSLRSWIRWAGVIAVCTAIAGFSWFAFSPEPLDVSAQSIPAQYPRGTVIGSVPWRPEFTELDVEIGGAKTDYTDLNLVIQPDFPVAAVAQLSSIPNVSLEDKLGMTVHQVLIQGTGGSAKENPLVLVATDEGYRVRCERVPPGVVLRIVMAIVDIRWNPSPPQPNSGFGAIFLRDYLLRLKETDGGTYWYGHPGGDVYAPRPSPQNVKVYGTYVANRRRRALTRQISPLVITKPPVQPPA